jgi:hypothetical protein
VLVNGSGTWITMYEVGGGFGERGLHVLTKGRPACTYTHDIGGASVAIWAQARVATVARFLKPTRLPKTRCHGYCRLKATMLLPLQVPVGSIAECRGIRAG